LVGVEPDDRVASALRRAGGDDLLARRTSLHLHLLPVEALFLLRGGGDDEVGDHDTAGAAGQGRSVVDAITDHGHSLLIGFEFADGGDLVVGQQLGAHVGDTDLLREPDGGGGGIVAGEQHGVGAGQPGHCSDGGGGFGPHLVGDAEDADRAVLAEYDHGGVSALLEFLDSGGGGRAVDSGEQRGGRADLDEVVLNQSGDPPAGPGGELVGGGQIKATVTRSTHDRGGERMLAGVFGGGGQPQQLLFGESGTAQRADLGEFWSAVGERAGLVEGDPRGGAQLFHHHCGLDQHAMASGVRDGRQEE